MTDTRGEIDRSVETTAAVLNALSPPKLEQVRQQVMDELEVFIPEWISIKPEERAAVARRRAVAESFHASVRVHDFGGWRAA